MSSAALLIGIFIAGPFLVLAQQPGGDPVALPFGTVTTLRQELPYAIVGILLLPVVPYLLIPLERNRDKPAPWRRPCRRRAACEPAGQS